MGLLDDEVAVITGAGSGMAKTSTKVFVREGARVLAADISGAEKDTAAVLLAHGCRRTPERARNTETDGAAFMATRRSIAQTCTKYGSTEDTAKYYSAG